MEEKLISVNRIELAQALRLFARLHDSVYPVFSFADGMLTIESPHGKTTVPASGQWGKPVRVKKIRELAKVANLLLQMPEEVQTIPVSHSETGLFFGRYSVECTTRNVSGNSYT
ncbi:MAG: hypothetical protein JXR40_00245 [Pontiellaceae bacterium]|nr:hypothetical protein [Pontiellaceae bacterium]